MARVTVINDSADFLGLMEEILSEQGHEMVGLQAVKVSIHEVVDSKPDLLIIDLLLENTAQEVSGWELLLLARSHRMLRKIPVILCTAAVWELQRRANDLEEIADVHVRTKPFELEEMTSLVTELLGAASALPKLAEA